jgi:hypothetical protein
MATSKLALWNQVLGKLGVSATGRLTSVTQVSKNRAAIENCYDVQRKRELRRNYWSFAISRVVIRAIDTTDKIWTPGTWLVGSTYALNDVVVLSGETYISLSAANIGNSPVAATDEGPTAFWAVYRGPLTSSEWDTGLQYYRGEVVHVTTATWLAIGAPTAGTTPAEGPEWHEITGETQVATTYRSPVHGRFYAYVKPRDFLRAAPIDPKLSLATLDHLVEGDTIITDDPGPLDLRYVKNIANVTKFDALFDDAIACKVAFETCDEITQSNTKKATLALEYEEAVADARLVNAIEGYGAVEADEDELITVRF